jgi:hypothetical protein
MQHSGLVFVFDAASRFFVKTRLEIFHTAHSHATRRKTSTHQLIIASSIFDCIAMLRKHEFNFAAFFFRCILCRMKNAGVAFLFRLFQAFVKSFRSKTRKSNTAMQKQSVDVYSAQLRGQESTATRARGRR